MTIPDSIPAVLEDAATRFPDREAVVDGTQRVTFGALRDRARLVARALIASGIEAGDRVAGCSVHVVTEELDGGEVLGQAEVPLLPDDTVATLSDRVLAAEHRLYPQVLADFVAR